jgi:peptidoglycan L-alanyl-D-glutamate endopeptidase CwlK
MSRDLNELDSELFDLYQKFNLKMGEAGLIHVVTCTSRTILEQMALFTMGRLPTGDVNLFRHAAGLFPVGHEENRKVTWTLNSKHVTNMFDKDLNNDKARAFDFAILNRKGQAVWDIKVSLNENEIPDYEEAAEIGESIGLVSGARWKNPDWPHLELKEK